MAEYKFLLPSMGEGIMEATVTAWLKNVGDSIEEDESIVEVATDKVDSDVPSPVSGVLKEIIVPTDSVAKVGEPMAIITTEDEEAESATPKPKSDEEMPKPDPEVAQAAKEAEKVLNVVKTTTTIDLGETDKFLSPLVRSIAAKEGISAEELNNIKGSGQNGRVTKDDMLHYLKQKDQKTTGAPTPIVATSQSVSSPVLKSISIGAHDEIIEMDRMRKIIAQHMLDSKQISPHVSSFVEADMTRIVQWRNRVKNAFQKREGEKITFMPIIVEAIVKAIKDFPMINVSVDGDKIIKKANINIGIAAARPDGNLIVPVIKNADQLNLIGLAKKINDLGYRAKNNQLKPDEIQGGTYTVSNIGSFGNLMGTPIINQPQVAIMAIGSIQKKPAVIETPEGDVIGIRHKMYLSHSYDHRVVDGALGGMFVKRVAEYLESFDINQEI
ncbi:2-oxo acid dehydrogenase subunit E2 [Ornithobacterium rhinotracheale]|uniref:dihydrolipoamide acetyltransferase family protein n=1 Tax=Ornithobacterium rhinotracheale TaxID=28251 RepID=UPI00129CD2F6|nr:dihydrolipoamide acetyltransferase family protein [Ornithobacterium rhinotracheale]MRJ08173.1 2-oxo acid dehydrogenase subunit E2 [Ornithobacterium rhinotracheale]UOH77371.1 2-oxo acid dehydrogenase subunit E2 [Ornithobacterium rhinotracheale]